MGEQRVMSLGDHLDELRRRLWLALLGPLPIVVVCLVFGGDILQFLLAPLEAQLKAANLPVRLLATGPAETFGAYLKVAIVAGLLLGAPWILAQLWLFVAPGLYRHERRFAYFLLPLSALLTVASAVFLYKALLPIMLRFFLVFGASIAPQRTVVAPEPTPPLAGPIPVLEGDPAAPEPGAMWVNETLHELRVAIAAGKEPAAAQENTAGAAGRPVRILGAPLSSEGLIAQQYRVSEYVNLLFTLGVVFALAFQLPVVMLLAGWVQLVEPRSLARWRRHIAFGCAVAGAALTPADPISMFLLAIPLYLLFELGLLLMRAVPASRVAGAREGPDAEA